MAVPIICFDLDGTLLDKNGKIHPNDIEILKTEKDAVFIPCTGRAMDSVEKMFHHNGLFQDGPIPFACITQNGAAVHKPGGEIFLYNCFSKDVQKQVMEVFDLFPNIAFMLVEKTRNLLFHPNEFSLFWMGRFSTIWEPYDEGCRTRDFGKATCISDDLQVFEDLSGHLKNLPVEIGVAMATIFDINPRGISKRSGVLSLLEYLDLKGAPIFAAGDGENDLDLLSLADQSFSPATSPLHVRKQTDHIVDIPKNGLLATMLEAARSA